MRHLCLGEFDYKPNDPGITGNFINFMGGIKNTKKGNLTKLFPCKTKKVKTLDSGSFKKVYYHLETEHGKSLVIMVIDTKIRISRINNIFSKKINLYDILNHGDFKDLENYDTKNDKSVSSIIDLFKNIKDEVTNNNAFYIKTKAAAKIHAVNYYISNNNYLDNIIPFGTLHIQILADNITEGHFIKLGDTLVKTYNFTKIIRNCLTTEILNTKIKEYDSWLTHNKSWVKQLSKTEFVYDIPLTVYYIYDIQNFLNSIIFSNFEPDFSKKFAYILLNLFKSGLFHHDLKYNNVFVKKVLNVYEYDLVGNQKLILNQDGEFFDNIIKKYSSSNHQIGINFTIKLIDFGFSKSINYEIHKVAQYIQSRLNLKQDNPLFGDQLIDEDSWYQFLDQSYKQVLTKYNVYIYYYCIWNLIRLYNMSSLNPLTFVDLTNQEYNFVKKFETNRTMFKYLLILEMLACVVPIENMGSQNLFLVDSLLYEAKSNSDNRTLYSIILNEWNDFPAALLYNVLDVSSLKPFLQDLYKSYTIYYITVSDYFYKFL